MLQYLRLTMYIVFVLGCTLEPEHRRRRRRTQRGRLQHAHLAPSLVVHRHRHALQTPS